MKRIACLLVIGAFIGTGSVAESNPRVAKTSSAQVAKTRAQWQGVRDNFRPRASLVPLKQKAKLSAGEEKQIKRIAGMKHISVVGDRLIGANEGYYEKARTGTSKEMPRMVSLQMTGEGKPSSQTQRGHVTKLHSQWHDGRTAETIEFRVPRNIKQLPKRLKRAGVYAGSKVSLRTISATGKRSTESSVGISISPAGSPHTYRGDGAYTYMKP